MVPEVAGSLDPDGGALTTTAATTATLLSLPLELLHRVISLLPLSAVFQLGSTNRQLHRIIHQDDRLWRFKLRRRRLLLWEAPSPGDDGGGGGFNSNVVSGGDGGDGNDVSGGDVNGDVGVETRSDEDFSDLSGLVHDPTLRGHKELFLLYSDEFREFLRSHREQRRSRTDQVERMLRSFLPRFLVPPKSSFLPDEPTRLALFGPGIESPRTKMIVHKVVNAHDSVFDAVSPVSGLPGAFGFGSGVRVSFRGLQSLDLLCLYTNSARVRETQRGGDRLLAQNNKLLKDGDDGGGGGDGQRLHENVLRLLPTVQALIFAVDTTDMTTSNKDRDSEGGEDLSHCRAELALMASGLGEKDRHTPLLVLSCRQHSDNTSTSQVDLVRLARGLGLTAEDSFSLSRRPWAVFRVDVADMGGMADALDWVLYHCQKRRSALEYHEYKSSSTS